MTTTLRPTGPEERQADGGRSRTYAICDNSRPVGTLRLTARPAPAGAGSIDALTVHEPDRRRGRATVAALAAEEVLRGWGCRRADVAVPAGAGGALRLAGALGYTESNRHLVKELGGEASGPPPLPGGSTVRPMSDTDFTAWLGPVRAEYARTWVRHGLPAAEAAAKAERDHATLLPGGAATPGTALQVLSHAGTDVGTLWLALPGARPAAGDAGGGYVYDVRVAREHRGRGHGRTLLLLAERECLAAGARSLALNVFADNAPARGLYDALGYRPARIFLTKPLW
ncbi:GNAT family N-acetyltransferase [Streptomyces sp. TRM 70351]|uniref:GNAT family N-acetyltransferase n=1 Tax=Streptomyces sp. TRM 70351 TaxID=3116552 RepID=UPI002E7B4308|nr:GNAT family N-acetyltransferase [Streptomyces sp. TRM 70351]MEE1929098.1 GNAT family N-acetyltransferase [Streptomyces sp. TRM 70351]